MTVPAPKPGTGNASGVKTLTMVGFKVVLGWHYLVLFSPLFVGSIESSITFFTERQLVLYLTLAASFAVLVIFGRFFLKRNKTTPSVWLIAAVGVLATASTALSTALVGASEQLLLAAVVPLGFSEAFLMFLWLHYYMEAAAGHLFRSFAVDMIAGGVLAFLACSLVSPLDSIVALCLPGVATVSLIANWRSLKPREVPSVVERPSRRAVARHSLKTLLPTAVYAFVFGMLQGSFSVSGVALLMAGSAFVLLGVVVAGIIIFFIPEAPDTNADIDTIHRFSLLFFVLGVVGLAFPGGGGGRRPFSLPQKLLSSRVSTCSTLAG